MLEEDGIYDKGSLDDTLGELNTNIISSINDFGEGRAKVIDAQENVRNNTGRLMVVGDLSGVFGVSGLPPDYLANLATRAITYTKSGGEIISEEVIGRDKVTRENILRFLNGVGMNVRMIIGDWREKSESTERLTYMQGSELYFDDDLKYIEQHKEKLTLTRKIANKTGFVDILGDLLMSGHLPDNTKVHKKFDDMLKDVKNRINIKQSFYVKAGEGASGENMIKVKFEGGNDFRVFYNAINSKKGKKVNSDNILSEINKSIPEKNRIIKSVIDSNSGVIYSESKFYNQRYLVQNIVEGEGFKEASMNFVSTDNGAFSTTMGGNNTKNNVHFGNSEFILPIHVQEACFKVVELLKRIGYRGEIGLDFIYNDSNVKFLEANPRYTAPLTPSIFIHNLENKEAIPKGYTWVSRQKFPFPNGVDIEKDNSFSDLRLSDNVVKGNGENGGFFCNMPPVVSKDYTTQSVIFVGKDQNNVNEVISSLNNRLYGKKLKL